MLRPNPPRMVTVVVAVALTAVGLALIWLPAGDVQDLIRQLNLPRDIGRTVLDLAAQRVVAFAVLLLSPVLLIVGSLVRGI